MNLFSSKYISETSNIDEIQKLDLEIFEPAWTKEQWKSWLNAENNHCYFIKTTSLVRGFLAVSGALVERTESPLQYLYEIIRVGILPPYRKNNIAFHAIQSWIQNIHKLHTFDSFGDQYSLRILLEVNQNNLGGIQLYQKLGFKKISERKKYYSDSGAAWVMEKKTTTNFFE